MFVIHSESLKKKTCIVCIVYDHSNYSSIFIFSQVVFAAETNETWKINTLHKSLQNTYRIPIKDNLWRVHNDFADIGT